METFRKRKFVDSFCAYSTAKEYIDWPLARFIQKHKKNSLLFSKYGKIKNFSTHNLYIHFIKSEKQATFNNLDGFLSFQKRMPIRYATQNREDIYAFIKEKYGSSKNYFVNIFKNPFSDMSVTKAWNMSVVGALIFGMFLMTSIYHYLGQGTEAASTQLVSQPSIKITHNSKGDVLGANTSASGNAQDYTTQMIEDYQKQQEKDGQVMLRKEMEKMVKGYPIEKMIPYIVKQDKIVAAFMIGIAKQESNWGIHVPHHHGQDCYNYWGYRGIRKKMGSGGHTCFDSPEDAVNTVAKRLKFLVSHKKLTTPGKMVVVWKCGYDCSWDNPKAVRRWVSAVNKYFKKFNNLTQ